MQNYNIITLGASGAGKTVFLASLFKQLSLPTEEGIYLEVRDTEQQKALNQIYAQVVNEKFWPRGTTKTVTKWNFTCCIKTQNLENFPVCQFTYLDYGGGILTDIDDEEDGNDFQFNFHQEVPQADAVIVLIDGQQLLKYIQTDFDLSDPGVRQWLMKDLPNTIQIANCVKKNPVHFVITKWDLLQGKYNLATVRECLENKCQEFKRLTNQRVRAGCPVRLIPISSVGKEFVTMQSDGSMKKKLGLVPKPFQLEIPLSYVLIDRVVAYKNNIEGENQNTRQSLEYKYSFLLDSIPDAFKRGKLLTRDDRIQNLKKVNDRKSAFNYLIDTFVNHITKFEQNHPQANLGGEIDILNSPLEFHTEDKGLTTFFCNHQQFASLTKNLEEWLDKQGFKHQTIEKDNTRFIQIAKKGLLRQFMGMSKVLTIQFTLERQQLKVKLFGGKWLDKAGLAIAGTLFFFPLLITSGIGAWQQSQLPREIMNEIAEQLK